MSDTQLKAAFIGAGPRSRSAHYPNVARLPEVAMTSVCELDEERLDMVVGQSSDLYPSFRDAGKGRS